MLSIKISGVWITSATKYEQISKRNKVGETKLHIAVIKGDIDRVKEHIEKFKDVNFPDHFGWTPLVNTKYYVDLI